MAETSCSKADLKIEEITEFLLTKIENLIPLKIGIICGSNLGSLADLIENRVTIPYKEVPHFPNTLVEGHIPEFAFGRISGVPVICMLGRFHMYEGYSAFECGMVVRVMKNLGVCTLFLSNAAGGLNYDYKMGDIMIIKDHIDLPGLAGLSALKGPNDDKFGPRFPGLINSYDESLRKMAREIIQKLGIKDIKEGVYVMGAGPCYETVAELKFLKMIGGDAVGMSTVPEVTIARHCGMDVFAFSVISDVFEEDGVESGPITHEEVLEATRKKVCDLKMLLKEITSSLIARKST